MTQVQIDNGTPTWDARVLRVIIKMTNDRHPMRKILPAVNKLRPGSSRNAIISKRAWLRQNGYLSPDTKFNSESLRSQRRSVSYEELAAYEQRRKQPSFHDGHFSIHPKHRVKLTDLEVDGCRWPYGHPGKPGFHFCCFTQIKGRPFCFVHEERAKSKGSNE